ncbi:MAG: NAD(P)-dependent oxidoreductase [Armatimonadetes bacterium]|nr:NAD(P)-dependent oxidoreductase [Armatimonadota bacterium]
MTVGFIGLGTMGAPMAGHLLKAGRDLVVWNRTPGKTDELKAAGARVANSLEDMAWDCGVICICVNRSEDVEECLKPIWDKGQNNALIIDHSTIAPEAARRFSAESYRRGMRFVDAPLTGGSMGAKNGTLTIFMGGEEADVAKASGIVEAYAKNAQWVGLSGQGQMMKLANQIAVGASVLGLCETMAFAEKAGLNKQQALEMIGSGAGGSWAFNNYGPKVLAEDWSPGFSIKNQRKDFGYCKDAAAQVHADLPGIEMIDALMKRLDDEGHGEWATCSLYELYMRGITN